MSRPVPNPGLRRLLAPLVLAALPLFAHAAAIRPGAPAPDFTLHATDGRNLRLDELRGQVVLVNFWATWCGPCREEMPHLDTLYGKYRKSGFVLLGVNIDDDPNTALATARKLGVSFPVLLDTDKQVSKRYDLSTMPSTVVIDRDGKVRYVHRGYRDGVEAEYDRQIRALLEE
ncbi:MAG TPA: TlpA disulfide reductase family protein [Burkholderiaceae bacterium]